MTRSRASHTKSRQGCTFCKQRHVKCDEAKPSCHRCLQAGVKCERLETPAPRRTLAGFRAFKMVTIPRGPKDAAPQTTALDFFRQRTLPHLKTCQPSLLWDVSAPLLMQSGRTFRSVAAALAHQQRLVEDAKACTISRKDADAAYVEALSLVRKSITTHSGGDYMALAFECLLLVILESLRGSRSEMVVHLHSGIRILNETPVHTLRSPEMKEIARFLRQYGVSTMLLDPFLPLARQTQALMKQAADRDGDGSSSDGHDLHSLSNELYRLIVETVGAMQHVYFNGNMDFEFCGEVARLRSKQSDIQQVITTKRQDCPGIDGQEAALWYLTEARCLSTKAHLEYCRIGDEAAFDKESETFRKVTVLLESALSTLSEIEDGSSKQAFSVGLGVISALELVAWRCRDITVRKKAVELLERCPKREGLWNADERGQLWRTKIALQEQKQLQDLEGSKSRAESNAMCKVDSPYEASETFRVF